MSTHARGRAYIAEETYLAHIKAATDLHRAHMCLIIVEQAGTKEEREEADAALGHKRKAAATRCDCFPTLQLLPHAAAASRCSCFPTLQMLPHAAAASTRCDGAAAASTRCGCFHALQHELQLRALNNFKIKMKNGGVRRLVIIRSHTTIK